MNDVSPIVALLVMVLLIFINGILASAEMALGMARQADLLVADLKTAMEAAKQTGATVDEVVYDGNTKEWNMPIGPRLDKVTKLGNQHLNIFGGTYNNAESIADTGKWLSFPKIRTT